MSETMRVNLGKIAAVIVVLSFGWTVAWATATAHQRLAVVEIENSRQAIEIKELRDTIARMSDSVTRTDANVQLLLQRIK